MNSKDVRQTFLDFFKSKGHVIVPSAPMVIKNDPTLMFTNAGMNQFKDLFLGNAPIKHPRIADTQKCLRVSGKHNDLEEVGVDTYHHTMFEMLGNWSFGDYFKKEAIEWSWELLTEVYKIDKSRLYVTVFEGSKEDGLAFDQEAYDHWKKYIAEDRIIKGNKKDNFWEMGDTGPCGPCSEIHVDIRTDEERKKKDGKLFVNASHPQVIEIWNNVFMEFNRKSDGSLEKLPAQHVDTGMGFERLCVVLQGKQSNYDTDVFQPLIQFISKGCEKKYGENEKTDIAMRVIADHVRAISFSIADGQLPSNTGAGYVIRRILRRAVRYGYQSLGFKEPFICKLSEILVDQMSDAFPELKKQQTLIEKVIREEETSFYKTLERGLSKINSIKEKVLAGDIAFELYDTFGFPIDLTELIGRENGFTVDMAGFTKCMEQQKNRSREATAVDTGDWNIIEGQEAGGKGKFVGYDSMETEAKLIQYRQVKAKNKDQYQIVLDKTPFYAESGGQVGDAGFLDNGSEKISIVDTKKENGIIIHFADKLPKDLSKPFKAVVSKSKRSLTENNHSATHLLHAALRKVLGTHVEQKGSLVNDEYLRFDFSHFSKVTDEELAKIEQIVNEKIREDIHCDIKELPIEEAKKSGAMALFGEKYGDLVRVVTFDKNYSIELCGGTHVKATGQIGFFKIISESAVAAGVRRMEAITSVKAEEYVNQQIMLVAQLKELLKNPKDLAKSVQALLEQNSDLGKQLESLLKDKVKQLKVELLTKVKPVNGVNFISEKISLDSADAIKDLSFELRNEVKDLFMVLGAEVKGKPSLSVIISDNLVADKKLNASNIVRELAKEIQGGGGGQPFYATAGGTDLSGLDKALEKAKSIIQ
jgi:alanyl-tRNA synthetase